MYNLHICEFDKYSFIYDDSIKVLEFVSNISKMAEWAVLISHSSAETLKESRFYTFLNRNGKNRHPCLLPDLRETAFGLSPLNMMLVGFFSYIAFVTLRKFYSISVYWVFYHWMVLNFIKCLFCISGDNCNYDFSLSSMNVVCWLISIGLTILAFLVQIPFSHGT